MAAAIPDSAVGLRRRTSLLPTACPATPRLSRTLDASARGSRRRHRQCHGERCCRASCETSLPSSAVVRTVCAGSTLASVSARAEALASAAPAQAAAPAPARVRSINSAVGSGTTLAGASELTFTLAPACVP